MVDAATGGEGSVRPGMVTVIQTARSDLGFSLHIHGLASRGGWTPDSLWVPVPFVDPSIMVTCRPSLYDLFIAQPGHAR